MTKNNLIHSSTTIRLLNIDGYGCEEILLEKMGCLLKILSIDLELWQIEFYDNAFILGIGYPFKIEEYSQAIGDLFHAKEKDEFLSWLDSIFKKYGFGKKESLLLRVEYTSRFVRNTNGYWKIFFPWEGYYMGGPERPYLPIDSGDNLFPMVGESFHKWLEGELDKLYPDESPF